MFGSQTDEPPLAPANDDAAALSLAVGIATTGRPAVLAQVVERLGRQSRPPDRIIVCPVADADLGDLEEDGTIKIVRGGRGLPRQRNAILTEAAGADVLVFFDDDFLPAENFLEEVERHFLADDDLVLATGFVIADGVKGAGFSIPEAEAFLAEDRKSPQGLSPTCPVMAAYGCNMALRLEAVDRFRLRFDEALPLYAWLEDWDFSGAVRAAMPEKKIVKAPSLRGVHLGEKKGRQPGIRLGYSQIVNGYYIARKGTLPRRWLLRLAVRNLAANLFGSVRGDDTIDRPGRLKGNLAGLYDIVRGRADPSRIEHM